MESQTSITAIGITYTLLVGLAVLVLPRRQALFPLVLLACTMTFAQRVVIATLDLTIMRMILFLYLLRVVMRGEWKSLSLNRNDRRIMLWLAVSSVAFTLLRGSVDSVVNRLGFAYNVLGLYFLFRLYLTDFDDIQRLVKYLAICLVPLAFFMFIELETGRNFFAQFGGVPPYTMIREGKLRCQGPFGHPISAGLFGAACVPFFAGLFVAGNRLVALAGIAAATVITYASVSSTPAGAYMMGIVGILAWQLRERIRLIRWGIILIIIGLDIVMKAPVWYLLARIQILSGSTAYHRAYLIDRAVNNLGEWWLLGTESTAHWGHQLFDITNQYIRYGVDGGLLALVLFLWIIVSGFGTVGTVVRAPKLGLTHQQRFMVWCLGTGLFAHCVAFLGLSYWDQIIVLWYLQLAVIGSVQGIYERSLAGSTSSEKRPAALTQRRAAFRRPLGSVS